MKTSTKLLLSGAVIISLSLIVFGTDAFLSLIVFYQNLENPSAREMAEGISDSIGSALFGVALGFLGVCIFVIGFISIFFEKRSLIDGGATRRKRFSEY
jgi:hypothetical protein